MKLKTLKDLRIEEELCEKLDSEVYLPVKKELEGIGTTYSLGSRKEDFKGLIEKKFNDLKQEAIKDIKQIQKQLKEGSQTFSTEISKEKKIIFKINGEEVSMEEYTKKLDLSLFSTPGTINYIKQKFNITEEDLK